jgi:hypothetical protein
VQGDESSAAAKTVFNFPKKTRTEGRCEKIKVHSWHSSHNQKLSLDGGKNTQIAINLSSSGAFSEKLKIKNNENKFSAARESPKSQSVASAGERRATCD